MHCIIFLIKYAMDCNSLIKNALHCIVLYAFIHSFIHPFINKECVHSLIKNAMYCIHSLINKECIVFIHSYIMQSYKAHYFINCSNNPLCIQKVCISFIHSYRVHHAFMRALYSFINKECIVLYCIVLYAFINKECIVLYAFIH